MSYVIFGVLEISFWIGFIILIITQIPEEKRSLRNMLLLNLLFFPLAFLLYKLKILYQIKLKYEETSNNIELVSYHKKELKS